MQCIETDRADSVSAGWYPLEDYNRHSNTRRTAKRVRSREGTGIECPKCGGELRAWASSSPSPGMGRRVLCPLCYMDFETVGEVDPTVLSCFGAGARHVSRISSR